MLARIRQKIVLEHMALEMRFAEKVILAHFVRSVILKVSIGVKNIRS